MPRSATSSGSLSSAWAPQTIFVGQLNSKPFMGAPFADDGAYARGVDGAGLGARYAARQPKNSLSSAVNI